MDNFCHSHSYSHTQKWIHLIKRTANTKYAVIKYLVVTNRTSAKAQHAVCSTRTEKSWQIFTGISFFSFLLLPRFTIAKQKNSFSMRQNLNCEHFNFLGKLHFAKLVAQVKSSHFCYIQTASIFSIEFRMTMVAI